MVEALTAREFVQRIVIAANCGESPGGFRLNLAQKEAEKILRELQEAYVAELDQHYRPDLADD